MEQACDSGKYGCELFLDLQMAFDTVNYYILLKKLNHYGTRGIANNRCNLRALKIHYCRFENFAICSGSYKNHTLEISHS